MRVLLLLWLGCLVAIADPASTIPIARRTKWLPLQRSPSPAAVRYHLGGGLGNILVELVEPDGARSFFWGRWVGPGAVVVLREVALEEGLAVTGQLDQPSWPAAHLFRREGAAYRTQGLRVEAVGGAAPEF